MQIRSRSRSHLLVLPLLSLALASFAQSPSDYCTGQSTYDTSALLSRGAEVKVIVVKHAPPLPTFEHTLESVCASWRVPNRVSILVATTDRASALYYGPAFARALNPYSSSIVTSMDRFLRSGNVDAGVRYAIRELVKVIDTEKTNK